MGNKDYIAMPTYEAFRRLSAYAWGMCLHDTDDTRAILENELLVGLWPDGKRSNLRCCTMGESVDERC